jgi:chitin disaccharide deacetylase
LNLSQSYAVASTPAAVKAHEQVVRFMNRNKFAMFLYNPVLRTAFRDVFQSQMDEFHRLYGSAPTHIDGHQHRHLCANMLVEEVIPRGHKVRRNFTYFPREKSHFNRTYRKVVDRVLAIRYRITDYFFSLSDCLEGAKLAKVIALSHSANVEVMSHPVYRKEYTLLYANEFELLVNDTRLASYKQLT